MRTQLRESLIYVKASKAMMQHLNQPEGDFLAEMFYLFQPHINPE